MSVSEKGGRPILALNLHSRRYSGDNPQVSILRKTPSIFIQIHSQGTLLLCRDKLINKTKPKTRDGRRTITQFQWTRGSVAIMPHRSGRGGGDKAMIMWPSHRRHYRVVAGSHRVWLEGRVSAAAFFRKNCAFQSVISQEVERKGW